MSSWFSAVLVMFFGVGAFAQETPAPTDTDTQKIYFYVGFGFAPYPQHDSGLQNTINQVRGEGLWAITAAQIALPGIYYRVNENRLLGILPQALLEQYGRDRTDPRNFSISAYSLLFSWIEFLKPKYGDGFFYRGDVGPTYLEILSEGGVPYGNQYGGGLTLQGGFGYSFDFFHCGQTFVEVGPYLTHAGSHTLWGGLVQFGVML